MARTRKTSKHTFLRQTLAILTLLHERLHAGAYGYEIMRETGVKSGILYPVLISRCDTLIASHAEIGDALVL